MSRVSRSTASELTSIIGRSGAFAPRRFSPPTENATEGVPFESANDKAKDYTIRVRQAR